MEIQKNFSHIGCGALSDSIEFMEGIKKAGPIALKAGALVGLSFAVFQLYRYATGAQKQILPNCIKWDNTGITLLPRKTEQFVLIPKEAKEGKTHVALVQVTKFPMPSVSDTLIYTALLAIASVAMRTLAGTLEQGLQTSSDYFQCKA
jgi:hypothetical protein